MSRYVVDRRPKKPWIVSFRPLISTKKPMTNSLFHCIIEPICQYGSHDEGCCQTYLYGRSSPEVWIRLWQQSESCGPPATIYSDFLLRTSQHPWLKTGKVRGDTKTTTCTSYEHLDRMSQLNAEAYLDERHTRSPIPWSISLIHTIGIPVSTFQHRHS